MGHRERSGRVAVQGEISRSPRRGTLVQAGWSGCLADNVWAVSTSVAFFRNLNLGQRRSPTRSQLLEAFAQAGATSVVSFQTNGTVIFESGRRSPQRLADRAVVLLTSVCGYDDMAIARPVEWLRELDLDQVPDHAEVSFFDGPDPFPEPLPWEPLRGGLVVIHADRLHAVSVNAVDRTSGATWVLEDRLGVQVTSRGVPTMRRLLVKLAQCRGMP